MRRAVFGGTFDPIHVGHLAIAEAALTRERLDEVLFVPARRNPLKGVEPSVAADDRFEMVRRATTLIPRMRVSRLELDRTGPSYTVETLRALAREGDELFLLLGADALDELASWREPAEVVRLATLLVARRPGAPEPNSEVVRRTVPQARIKVLDCPLVDLSARVLRDHGRAGGSLRYLVPDAAWRYAAERGLYGQRAEATRAEGSRS